jgi:serine/threonine-protein kinase
MSNDPKAVASWISVGLAHADRALALEPRDADALELRGTLHTRPIVNGLVHDQREVDEMLRAAEKDLRAAITVNPVQSGALYVLSQIQYSKDEDQIEAYNLARRAYEADAYLAAAPQILWGLYSNTYDLDQPTSAEKWCDESKRRFPTELLTVRCQLWIMTTSAFAPPDPAEAWRRARAYENVAPPQEREYFRREGQIVVAAVLGRAGLPDSARRVLARARAGRDVDPRGELMGYEAFVRTMLKDNREAVDLLQLYLTNHPEHRRGFGKANAWWWRDLQSDARFKTLIASGR